MKTLDRTRPFGTIRGVSKARYTQDGCEFDVKGNLLISDLATAKVEVEPREVSVETLTIRELKEAVLKAGGTYRNRMQAIEFLKNDVS